MTTVLCWQRRERTSWLLVCVGGRQTFRVAAAETCNGRHLNSPFLPPHPLHSLPHRFHRPPPPHPSLSLPPTQAIPTYLHTTAPSHTYPLTIDTKQGPYHPQTRPRATPWDPRPTTDNKLSQDFSMPKYCFFVYLLFTVCYLQKISGRFELMLI